MLTNGKYIRIKQNNIQNTMSIKVTIQSKLIFLNRHATIVNKIQHEICLNRIEHTIVPVILWKIYF